MSHVPVVLGQAHAAGTPRVAERRVGEPWGRSRQGSHALDAVRQFHIPALMATTLISSHLPLGRWRIPVATVRYEPLPGETAPPIPDGPVLCSADPGMAILHNAFLWGYEEIPRLIGAIAPGDAKRRRLVGGWQLALDAAIHAHHHGEKGNVEAGVKVVTNWVIHYLADRVFASLDELNAAVAAQVGVINDRTPFRGEGKSRRDWFTEHERGELISLPARRWEPVIWRKAKVHRDWHIQLDTIKYSVPSRFAGLSVDVRIVGEQIDVLSGGEIIATHCQGPRRNGYVTDPEHAPAHAESVSGLWTRGYFLRQASKVGPGTVTALTLLLDGKVIEAQGYRSCMNILDLGKRGSRVLLEQACRGLVDEDPHRQITYTAVKNRITALRASLDARPTVSGHENAGVVVGLPVVGAPGRRDTSRAHLAGAGAFSLDALRSAGDQAGGCADA